MDAVGNYLRALYDPDSLRDVDAVDALRRQLAEAQDPVERLLLRSQLHQAENPSLDEVETGFIDNAKAWADGHGVGVHEFLDVGVDVDVLRRAGFSLPRGSRALSTSRGKRHAPRKPRVTGDAVRAAIPRRGPFTLRQLQDSSGASIGAVRAVVKAAVDSGELVEVGEDGKVIGPGRRPMRYKRA